MMGLQSGACMRWGTVMSVNHVNAFSTSPGSPRCVPNYWIAYMGYQTLNSPLLNGCPWHYCMHTGVRRSNGV